MRFVLDNDVDVEVRRILIKAGHDAWTASEAGLAGEDAANDDTVSVGRASRHRQPVVIARTSAVQPYVGGGDTVLNVKTTLVLDDRLVARVKREALATDASMSEIVEAALRAWFARAGEVTEIDDLPTHALGRPTVNLADREALHDLMEGR